MNAASEATAGAGSAGRAHAAGASAVDSPTGAPGAGGAGGAGASSRVEVLTRGTVVIERERCKGCELCIPACRPGVLTMSVEVNAIGYRFPELSAGCTGCRACHAVCPDYVFEVYKYDEPVLLPGPAIEPATDGGSGTGDAGAAEVAEWAGATAGAGDESGEAGEGEA